MGRRALMIHRSWWSIGLCVASHSRPSDYVLKTFLGVTKRRFDFSPGSFVIAIPHRTPAPITSQSVLAKHCRGQLGGTRLFQFQGIGRRGAETDRRQCHPADQDG